MSDPNERFPIRAQKRPLRFDGDALNPLAIAHQELKALASVHVEKVDQLLIGLAQTWFEVHRVQMELSEHGGAERGNWAEALAIIAANLNETLHAHQVSVRDLTGEPWTESLRGIADVRGSEPAPGITKPRVSHVEVPVIERGSRLLTRGVLFLHVPITNQSG